MPLPTPIPCPSCRKTIVLLTSVERRRVAGIYDDHHLFTREQALDLSVLLCPACGWTDFLGDHYGFDTDNLAAVIKRIG